MYYLDEIEYKLLIHDLLPRTRENPIDDRLRGWNWHQPPVRPYSFELQLPIWEIAGSICPTYRDVWIRRKVLRKKLFTTSKQAEGVIIHKIVSHVFKEAKKLIYSGDYSDLKNALLPGVKELVDNEVKYISELVENIDANKIKEFALQVADWEMLRIEGRINTVKAKYPYIDEEGLVSLAVPVSLEMPVDGRLLGLSSMLRVDASWLPGGLIYEIKTGYREKWHKLQVAGYALALESIYERPVDIGVVVYVNRAVEGIRVNRDIFVVSDDLRSRFLEKRDEIQMLLLKGEEPRIPDKCPRKCLFRNICLGE
ncbi:CRISPR-associated protein, Csa1 family [Staphylothermus marinus F1]|uniref:CRISPR-associated protein, Csa1 family n=1 Tax=Staphylothermus marinus (strain ATCC 43588 / DSM 3639 / JCM 9404 / F1) TaxID=399550 RepID=A3DLB8_STAMF|nr:type I-A CRISPR-associated protein Cas4/Csa1 [Staphylothermus marinus]ABN69428.1 CRISPR-associated protein, Csa1 family [Staphylothermus marinus F1]